MTLVTVYMPSGRTTQLPHQSAVRASAAARTKLLTDLDRTLTQIMTTYPNTDLIVVGDFNTNLGLAHGYDDADVTDAVRRSHTRALPPVPLTPAQRAQQQDLLTVIKRHSLHIVNNTTKCEQKHGGITRRRKEDIRNMASYDDYLASGTILDYVFVRRSRRNRIHSLRVYDGGELDGLGDESRAPVQHPASQGPVQHGRANDRVMPFSDHVPLLLKYHMPARAENAAAAGAYTVAAEKDMAPRRRYNTRDVIAPHGFRRYTRYVNGNIRQPDDLCPNTIDPLTDDKTDEQRATAHTFARFIRDFRRQRKPSSRKAAQQCAERMAARLTDAHHHAMTAVFGLLPRSTRRPPVHLQAPWWSVDPDGLAAARQARRLARRAYKAAQAQARRLDTPRNRDRAETARVRWVETGRAMAKVNEAAARTFYKTKLDRIEELHELKNEREKWNCLRNLKCVTGAKDLPRAFKGPDGYTSTVPEALQLGATMAADRGKANVKDPKFDHNHYQKLAKKVRRLRKARAPVRRATVAEQHMADECCATITAQDVIDARRKIVNGKTPGHDGVANEMMKYSGRRGAVALAILYDYMFTHSVHPSNWDGADVTPIHKKGSKTDWDNYRYVTMTSAMSKLYERILNDRLIEYLEGTGQLDGNQGGFRPQRGTPQQVYKLIELIRQRKRRQLPTYVCYIDIRKAFPSVDKILQLARWAAVGVRGKMWTALDDFFKVTRSRLRTSGAVTDYYDLTRGAREGSVLSPVAFLVFVDTLLKALRRNHSQHPEAPHLETSLGREWLGVLAYADDLVLIAHSTEELTKMMKTVDEWCHKWRLELNNTKSNVQRFGETKKTRAKYGTSQEWTFHVGSVAYPVKETTCYEYLGVHLQSSKQGDPFLWTEHRDKLSKSAIGNMHSVLAMGAAYGGLPLKYARTLWRTCVVPCLEYGLPFLSKAMATTMISDVQAQMAHEIMPTHGHVDYDRRYAELGFRDPDMRYLYNCHKLWGELHALPDTMMAKRRHMYNLDWLSPNAAAGVRRIHAAQSFEGGCIAVAAAHDLKYGADTFLRFEDRFCSAAWTRIQGLSRPRWPKRSPSQQWLRNTRDQIDMATEHKRRAHARQMLTDHLPWHRRALHASLVLAEPARIVQEPPAYTDVLYGNRFLIRPIALARIAATNIGVHYCYDEHALAAHCVHHLHRPTCRTPETTEHLLRHCGGRSLLRAKLIRRIRDWMGGPAFGTRRVTNAPPGNKRFPPPTAWWPDDERKRALLLLGAPLLTTVPPPQPHEQWVWQAPDDDEWREFLRIASAFWHEMTGHIHRE